MNITEANAVNTLLHNILDLPDHNGQPTPLQRAEDAAALLADRANKALGAGLTGQQVRNQFDALAVPTCRVCGCDDDHACPGGCRWTEADLCSACAAPDPSGADN